MKEQTPFVEKMFADKEKEVEEMELKLKQKNNLK